MKFLKGLFMRIRYSFSSMAASLVLVILSTQARLCAQYTIATLANSTASTGITAQGIAVDTWNNVYVTGVFNHSGWLDSGVINVTGATWLYQQAPATITLPSLVAANPGTTLGFRI